MALPSVPRPIRAIFGVQRLEKREPSNVRVLYFSALAPLPVGLVLWRSHLKRPTIEQDPKRSQPFRWSSGHSSSGLSPFPCWSSSEYCWFVNWPRRENAVDVDWIVEGRNEWMKWNGIKWNLISEWVSGWVNHRMNELNELNKNWTNFERIERILNELWTNFERILNEFWTKFERKLNEFWTNLERILNELNECWTNFERILNEFWTNYERIWTNLEWILNEFWTNFERILNEFWTNFERIERIEWIEWIERIEWIEWIEWIE